MRAEVQSQPPPQPAPPDAGGEVLAGADLVHLAEGLQVRMFRLTAGLVALGGALTVLLAVLSDDAPVLVTAVAVAGGLALAVVALRWTETTYLWLRRGPHHQAAITVFAAAVVLADGVDGPAWWVALTLLLMLSTVSSTPFALFSATAVALAFVAGALLSGGSLAAHGADAGVMAGAIGLPANTIVGRVVCESFARLVLSLHRAQAAADAARRTARQPPLVVENLASSAASPAAPPARSRPHGPFRGRPRSNRLTVRQLEVALLARDGLRQHEIAGALGISVTQVERHLRRARDRVGAANTNELLVLLVTDGLIGESRGAIWA